ncbi:uncharacterized protein LOC114529327 [Dendronephthya gigantea]|uniref:uncharacterized protein LOC114529327 n=1 Tax=Dendronephthya gigantea TaxID=151771 RepID=UPI001069463D|nr:uncharacterized protein LOC114529327 [Dendronephthya gigantea]
MVNLNKAAIVASSVLASTCITLIILVVYLLWNNRRKTPPYPAQDAIRYQDFPPLNASHQSVQPPAIPPLKYGSSLKHKEELEDNLDPDQYGVDMDAFYRNKYQFDPTSSPNQYSKSSDSLESIIEDDDAKIEMKGYHYRPLSNAVSLDNINTPCMSPRIRRIKKEHASYKHSSQGKDLSRSLFRGISERHLKHSSPDSSSLDSLRNLGDQSDEKSQPLASDSEQTSERPTHGEMLVALCHNPSEGKLTVTVKSAEGLKRVSEKSKINPFVQIRVYDSGERKYRKKTTVKQNTTSPEFEESFDFIVTGKRMPQTSVILSLSHHRKRLINKDDLIGVVFLGYQFELDNGHPFKLDYGARHWASVIEKPHLTIEKWHPIQAITNKGS